MQPASHPDPMWLAKWKALPQKERDYWLECAVFDREIARMKAAQDERRERLARVKP